MRILLLLIVLSLPASAQDFEGLLPINGTELQAKSIGKGTPIIILHGGPGLNYSYFFPHLNELAKNNRLIFFDQRASGKSSAALDSAQMTLDMMTADIDAIRRHFKYDKVNILAHSFGGLLAMKYAINYPGHVDKMILVSSIAPKSGEFAADIQRATLAKTTKADSIERAAILSSDDFKAGKGTAIEKLLKLTFKPGFYDRAYTDSITLNIDDDFMTKRKTMMLLVRDLNSYNLYPDLGKIKAKVLIVHGAADVNPEALSIKMQDAIHGSKRVTIAKAGHWTFAETKSEFGREVEQFLK